MTIETLGHVTGIAAVAVPAMVWLLAKIRRWVRRVSEIHRKIDAVFAELTPNGGKSIKDSVNQLVREVSVLRQGLSFSFALHPNAIFEADAKGDFTFANQAMCDLLGMAQADLLGRNWLLAVADPEDREEAYDRWSRCVQSQLPYQDTLQLRNPKTGERFRVRARAVVAEREGRPLHYYGTFEREI